MRPLAGIWLVVVATLAACAPAATIRPAAADLTAPARTSLELSLPGVTTDQAIDRVKAAFIAEGLAIASAAGGVVTSEPVQVLSVMSTRVDKRYTATIIGGDGGARVVLAGGSRLAGRDEPFSAMSSHDPSWPASEGYHGWLKVRRITARIAGEPVPEQE
jgi:hypothetical protein